jgi:hypothetical protein
VPLAMTLVYYFLSVFGLDGPDKMQLIAAETSLILLIVVPFPFPPLGSVLEKTKWSLVLQSLCTRVLSLLNGCNGSHCTRNWKALVKVSTLIKKSYQFFCFFLYWRNFQLWNVNMMMWLHYSDALTTLFAGRSSYF